MKVPVEALCTKRGLHSYSFSREEPDALIEVCVFCNNKLILRKVDGHVDTLQQVRAHFRDTVQPFGRSGQWFRRLYGEKELSKAIKNAPQRKRTKDEQANDWEQAHREAVKDLRQRDDYGKKLISH